MRTIKLMADYQCSPLWNISPGDYYNIDPDELPMSQGLRAKLMDWAQAFDATLNMADPLSSPGFTDEERALFQREGAELAKRLRDELGPDYSIISKL